jgi:hypothetical protein
MSLISAVIVMAPLLGRSYYLKRQEDAHEQWLDEMASICVQLDCEGYVPGLQRKLLDLHARAEQLTGEDLDVRVGYVN